MKALLIGFLLGTCGLYAADVSDWNGTWKVNVAKSDFSKNPYGAPREATLTFAKSGWTYKATDAKGQQISMSGQSGSNAVSGVDNATIRDEPVANPFVKDVRFGMKHEGKEMERVITTLLPDGKEWSDVRYFEKVK